MKKIIILLILAYLFSLIFPSKLLLAELGLGNAAVDESITSDTQEARYVLLMMKGRSLQNTRVPAIILDSVQGIVWTCKSLQEDRPIWIRTDLARNTDDSLSRKKYLASIPQWQEANAKVPAIVLDTDEGKTWTCSDIITNGDTWVQTDFKNALQKEIRGTEVKF